MRILIAAIHYPVASGRFIQRAFKRLGHDVRTMGPTTGNDIWGMKVDPKWVWTPYYPAKDIPAWDIWQPELVITADSAYTVLGVGPHVLWGQDNHVRDYRFPELGGVTFDAMFLAHSWGNRITEPNAFWLPPCYDPEICVDLGQERDIDVAFVGYPYDERVQIITALQGAGLKVFAALGLLYEDYQAVYNRAKIALVRSACGDVGNRFLEGLAFGCCVLADRVPDASRMGFVEGRDYMPYENAEHAVRVAKYLLESGEWKRIAGIGSRMVRGHSWDDRAREMLRTLHQIGLIPNKETSQ